MAFAWRLGYSISVPLVVLLVAGRLLDRRWGTHPWMLLIGLGLSFVITSVLLFRESLRVMREAQLLEPTKPEKKGDHTYE